MCKIIKLLKKIFNCVSQRTIPLILQSDNIQFIIRKSKNEKLKHAKNKKQIFLICVNAQITLGVSVRKNENKKKTAKNS